MEIDWSDSFWNEDEEDYQPEENLLEEFTNQIGEDLEGRRLAKKRTRANFPLDNMDFQEKDAEKEYMSLFSSEKPEEYTAFLESLLYPGEMDPLLEEKLNDEEEYVGEEEKNGEGGQRKDLLEELDYDLKIPQEEIIGLLESIPRSLIDSVDRRERKRKKVNKILESNFGEAYNSSPSPLSLQQSQLVKAQLKIVCSLLFK